MALDHILRIAIRDLSYCNIIIIIGNVCLYVGYVLCSPRCLLMDDDTTTLYMIDSVLQFPY